MRKGFSLVELSIVLVILGLLVGGVLAGKSLIRAAELRTVGRQYQQYIAAVHTFRDKYFQLPGDMNNAQSIWGVAHATPATCKTTASTSALTCNGDGDGIIGWWAAGSNEPFRFWQHLANAGLIEGNYDGITHGSAPNSTTSANSPTGKISQSLWYAGYIGTMSADFSTFDGVYNNIFEFGGFIADSDPYTGVLTPEDAWNIDTKLDDGKPGAGKILARDVFGFSGTNCTTAVASTAFTSNYYLANTNTRCVFYFRNMF